MTERWQEIRGEITESTSVWDVYKLEANRVAKFLANLEERISRLEEVRVLQEEEKKPECEECEEKETKPEGGESRF